jgi:biotin carboxylase
VLAAIGDLPKPDMVLALSEFDMIAAGQIREALNVPGPKLSDALLVRDKVIMKSAVAESGVKVPRFMPLAGVTGPGQVPWTGATVPKPSKGAASQGVVVLPTVAEAIAAARDTVAPDDIADFEIEEYLPGRVIHIDGLVSGGRALALQPSRYINTCLDYAGGTSLGSVQFSAADALVEWTLRCLAAVGITDGPFHLEAIEAADELAFMEVAARWGGGPVAEAFELATGLWLPSMAVRLAVDGPRGLPPARSPEPAQLYGWFLIPGHKLGSQFCRITGEREFRDHPLTRRRYQRTSGEPVSLFYAMENVPAAGVVGPSSETELEELIFRVFATIQVNPVPAADAIAALS